MAGMHCVGCSRLVYPKERPWFEVSGWERDREAGGTNHVALRKRTNRIMCPECMVAKQHGVENQMTLGS